MMEEEKVYSPKQFGQLIGRSVVTLQRWDRKGILIARCSPTNRRYSTHQQDLEYLRTGVKKAEDQVSRTSGEEKIES